MKNKYREIQAAPIDSGFINKENRDNENGFHTFNPNTNRAAHQAISPEYESRVMHIGANVNKNMTKSSVLITMANNGKTVREKNEESKRVSGSASGRQSVSIPRLDMQKINEFRGQMMQA